MKANEARARTEAATEALARVRRAAQQQVDEARKRAEAAARKDVRKVLKEVRAKIKAAADGRLSKADHYVSRRDAEHGRAYLSIIGDRVETALTKDGYNAVCYFDDSYTPVYEGTMNPECVGQEYVGDTIRISVTW